MCDQHVLLQRQSYFSNLSNETNPFETEDIPRGWPIEENYYPASDTCTERDEKIKPWTNTDNIGHDKIC